jgi:hypothetical protein
MNCLGDLPLLHPVWRVSPASPSRDFSFIHSVTFVHSENGLSALGWVTACSPGVTLHINGSGHPHPIQFFIKETSM